MNTTTTVIIIQALLTYGPALARALVEILSKKTEPTLAEWEAIFALAEKKYEDYVDPKPI